MAVEPLTATIARVTDRILAPAETQLPFVEVARRVVHSEKRVGADVDGIAVVLLTERSLDGMDETIEILSDPAATERIRAGDLAIQTGGFVWGRDLADEVGVLPDTLPHPQRWRLMVSSGCRDALASRATPAERAEITRYITGRFLDDPAGAGVELVGDLERLYVAHFGGKRLVYRLDALQRAVRMVEIMRGDFLHLQR